MRPTVLLLGAVSVMLLAAMATPLAAADANTVEVLTLKDGREIEGSYNPDTGVLTLAGKIKGSVKIDKNEIVRIDIKKVAPAPPAEAAAAAAPADPAKKEAARLAVLRLELNRQKEQKAASERLLAQYEQRNQTLPDQITSLEARAATDKRALADAESRKVSEDSSRDWYYRYYGRRWTPGDGGSNAAEGARRRAQADAAASQRELDKAYAERKKIDRELPLTRTRVDQCATKIAELEAQLAAAPPAAP